MYLSAEAQLVCDFKIRKLKDIRRKFVPSTKILKLHEDSVNTDFRSANTEQVGGVVGGQKAQLYIKKHGGMMMLVILLVGSGNYGKSRNSKMQVRRSI